MAQLREFYRKEVVPVLTEKFGYDNPMRVPKITKVVLNMGVGEALTDKKVLENAADDLTQISGQKVVITKARKSIAGFKVREGWPVGCKVTLRGERMYDFLERLVDIAIPRIRDFPWLESQVFRWSWQLCHGRYRADYFPRDRLRQDRYFAWTGHCYYYYSSKVMTKVVRCWQRCAFRSEALCLLRKVLRQRPAEEVVEETPAAEEAPALMRKRTLNNG